jgi:hypothetical protein
VREWRRGQQTRGAVYSEIRVTLNELPQEPYPQSSAESGVIARRCTREVLVSFGIWHSLRRKPVQSGFRRFL